MTVSLAWRNAVAQTDSGWLGACVLNDVGFAAQGLPAGLVARFQIDYRPSPRVATGNAKFPAMVATDPVPENVLNALIDHIESACKSGALRSELVARDNICVGYKEWTISAQDFCDWLTTNQMKPSVHIQAWFDEAGVTPKTTSASGEQLATNERNTLLVIIAALCREAKIDYTKPAKAAGMILHTADGMGVKIGETTIERHLKKIPDAVETRMK